MVYLDLKCQFSSIYGGILHVDQSQPLKKVYKGYLHHFTGMIAI